MDREYLALPLPLQSNLLLPQVRTGQMLMVHAALSFTSNLVRLRWQNKQKASYFPTRFFASLLWVHGLACKLHPGLY